MVQQTTTCCRPSLHLLSSSLSSRIQMRRWLIQLKHHQLSKTESERPSGKQRAASDHKGATPKPAKQSPACCGIGTGACQPGNSSWPTACPLQEHGFALHNNAFRDVIALRFRWDLLNFANPLLCLQRGAQHVIHRVENEATRSASTSC